MPFYPYQWSPEALARLPQSLRDELIPYNDNGWRGHLSSFSEEFLCGRVMSAALDGSAEQIEALGWLCRESECNFPRGCVGTPEKFEEWTGLNRNPPAEPLYIISKVDPNDLH
ncbi:hypothetical protein ACFP9V_18585 [Deinococcus radiopugnans]|uniref:Uncharacterized protein n=1 Tax=Deinococcus radiopugnans ATCC 19172 TaxID=585398 RepID=A0A5C4Y7Y0_9DEIO|nr:hypothetical protein [Deinococcus radiopugnans]MBB6017435.1 hypothetical protein [Deinococcus radiopugnans ATCC 19172]TNM71967.1 hypothetical protein FHR04_06280 [Deinococcus radiopugnans ATCC 19172]